MFWCKWLVWFLLVKELNSEMLIYKASKQFSFQFISPQNKTQWEGLCCLSLWNQSKLNCYQINSTALMLWVSVDPKTTLAPM